MLLNKRNQTWITVKFSSKHSLPLLSPFSSRYNLKYHMAASSQSCLLLFSPIRFIYTLTIYDILENRGIPELVICCPFCVAKGHELTCSDTKTRFEAEAKSGRKWPRVGLGQVVVVSNINSTESEPVLPVYISTLS